MKADPAVAAYGIAPEDHWAFLAGLAAGTPHYDLLYKRHAAANTDAHAQEGKKASAEMWKNILHKFNKDSK